MASLRRVLTFALLSTLVSAAACSDGPGDDVDEPTNTPPAFQGLTDATETDEGDTLELDVACADADGDTVTLALHADNTCGGTLAGRTYTLQTGESDGGSSCTASVTCSDGFDETVGAVDVSILEVNVAPQITSLPASESTPSRAEDSLPMSVDDPDLPANSFTWAVAENGCNFDVSIGSDGVAAWTCGPDEESCDVTLEVTDDGEPAMSDTGVLSLGCTNGLARFEETEVGDAAEQELFEHQVTCIDDEDDPLTLALGMSDTCGGNLDDAGDGTGTYSFTPDETQGGSDCVMHVTCEDNAGTESRTATVGIEETNQPPVIDTTVQMPSPQWGGGSGEVTLLAADADVPAQSLTWSMDSTTCQSAPTLSDAGLLSWTCNAYEACEVTVAVTDEAQASTQETFALTCANELPTVSNVTISPAVLSEGDTPTCAYDFQDADGDADNSTISWTVGGSPAGMGASPNTTVAMNDQVVCEVTPNDGAQDGTPVSTSKTVTNRPPEITNVTLSPQRPFPGQELTCTAMASDTDGDSTTVAYAWDVDGTVLGQTSTTLPGHLYDLGSTVTCTVTADDGTISSEVGTSVQAMDLYPVTDISKPFVAAYSFVEVGSLAYFATTMNDNSRAIGITDGTSAGTERLQFTPGLSSGEHLGGFGHLVEFGSEIFLAAEVNDSTSSQRNDLFAFDPQARTSRTVKSNLRLVSNLTVVNNLLVFTAVGGSSNQEVLYRSDGTDAGTVPVQNGNSTVPVRSDDEWEVVGGKVYFIGEDSTHGRELWGSDGTDTGTSMVSDINSGTASTRLEHLTPAGNLLYFTAETTTEGVELWRSDGTTAGTQVVADINPGPADSNPWRPHAWGGELYFSADDGTGYAHFRTDPSNGVVKLHDDFASEHASFQNRLYFIRQTSASQDAIWSTDGTPSGTTELAPGATFQPRQIFGAYSGRLVFLADDSAHGRELWSTDGTTAGTALLKDIRQGPGNVYLRWKGSAGSKGLFTAYDDQGVQLWSTDGTTTGTERLTTSWGRVVNRSPRGTFSIDGTLAFFAGEYTHLYSLWTSDGTMSGTGPISDASGEQILDMDQYNTSYVTTDTGDAFVAYEDPRERKDRVAFSDGTNTGTYALPHATSGIEYDNISELTSIGTRAVFRARSYPVSGSNSEYQLHVADSSAVRVIDARPNTTAGLGPTKLTGLDGVAVFEGTDEDGAELWRSDGTEAGTYQLADINPGSASSSPEEFTVLSGGTHALFFADDGTRGPELWVTDGSIAETERLTDVDVNSSQLRVHGSVNGKFVFLLDEAIHGRELWVSDLTASGTSLLLDTVPGTSGSADQTYSNSYVRNGLLYVSLSNINGPSLWVTNGSPSGTRKVVDLYANDFFTYGGQLYFYGNDPAGVADSGIWVTDGTSAGTQHVVDPNPGGTAQFDFVGTVNGIALFRMTTWNPDDSGPWIFNGVTGQTMWLEHHSGNAISGMRKLYDVGGSTYVWALDEQEGRELWIIE